MPNKDPFRTLDDPEPAGSPIAAGSIPSGAIYADGIRTERKWRLRFRRAPNLWHRFWCRVLLGARWEKADDL
jgi:hypothetical protein